MILYRYPMWEEWEERNEPDSKQRKDLIYLHLDSGPILPFQTRLTSDDQIAIPTTKRSPRRGTVPTTYPTPKSRHRISYTVRTLSKTVSMHDIHPQPSPSLHPSSNHIPQQSGYPHAQQHTQFNAESSVMQAPCFAS